MNNNIFFQLKYYSIILLFFIGCEKGVQSNESSSSPVVFEDELIILDQNGNISETSIDIDDFVSIRQRLILK